MGDRDISKIRKAKQCLVRHFAHLPNGLQAGREQCVLYPRWEVDFTEKNNRYSKAAKSWLGNKKAAGFSPAGFVGVEHWRLDDEAWVHGRQEADKHLSKLFETRILA